MVEGADGDLYWNVQSVESESVSYEVISCRRPVFKMQKIHCAR